MHGLVGCCYVPCDDDDDESQGFVPVAGHCTTLRREPRLRSGLLGAGCWTFSGSVDVETIPAGVPASLERWVRVECGDSERGEHQVRGLICLDEKIMTRALHAAGPLEYCVAI